MRAETGATASKMGDPGGDSLMGDHPTSFGRYRISRVLGEGAMGTVFVAADDVLGREVAIKAIRPFAQLDGRARFLNEARAIAGLIHPNVVQVFDVGEQGDAPFLVMEMAAGGSLRARLQRDHKLPTPAVRVLGIQIAHALAAAHARGIVHRDVKPANILEGEHGIWKLADFGVAHVPDTHLTITGQFLGSPAYAAPESLLAGAFGPASDVYGLACTLFECVTGAGPHDQGGIETRMRPNDAERTIQAAALAPANDPELVAAILRGLSRDPAGRPTAAELCGVARGKPDEARAVPDPLPALARCADRRRTRAPRRGDRRLESQCRARRHRSRRIERAGSARRSAGPPRSTRARR